MIGKVVGYHPLIPEGIYLVRYTGYETGQSWNSKKVILHFAVVEGEYSGIPLKRYYNAAALEPPIGPNGCFTIGDRSHLIAEYRALVPEVQSTSEIDLNCYRGKFIRAQVGTTKNTGFNSEIPAAHQYSVIRKLLEVVPGSLSASGQQTRVGEDGH